MTRQSTAVSSMLITFASFSLFTFVWPHLHGPKLSSTSSNLAGRPYSSYAAEVQSVSPFQRSRTSTSCSENDCGASSTIYDPTTCDDSNGTVITSKSGANQYTIICNIDYPEQDIYPFILAKNFTNCLAYCESLNSIGNELQCKGFVFAPSRLGGADDCYLKSSVERSIRVETNLMGAVLLSSHLSPASVSIASESEPKGLTRPSVTNVNLLGDSTNNPTKQYISHVMAVPQKLASSMLVPGINTDLVTEFPIAGDTGIWTHKTAPSKNFLSDMSVTPHMSRDGGKGGTVNGSHLFIFCDTASFQIDPDGSSDMVGFVSSSVATDEGMNGLKGEALNLIDHIGEWQDDVGRMRGFAPMTTGEESFNIQLSGDGSRYAVWPQSSLISLNYTHSVLYAALVYDEVNMTTQAATFTSIGNTLLVVGVDSDYGPHAERVARQLFNQDQIAFGVCGGLRLWGPSGIGGMDGEIYLFGQTDAGILLAKTSPTAFQNLSAYQYYNGESWTSSIPSVASKYVWLSQQVMDLDIIYSPLHRTFIMFYLTPFADNTFYFRWLQTDSTVIPAYEKGGDPNYARHLVSGTWSEEQVLFVASDPPISYIYAGGFHAGYFGKDDITNGGNQGLFSWTQHTGKDAASPETGYAHMTAVVTFA